MIELALGSESHIGNIYPFVEKQALKSKFSYSYLSGGFSNPDAWKKAAREKVFELLHYRPEKCAPNAEITERTDMGDYIREKIYFNTTPDIRVPAYVLIPKSSLPAPAIVALHDHGCMYRWGKEKIIDVGPVHPALEEFRRQAYSGKCYATELARRGYVVICIDAFYFGERRILPAEPIDSATETTEQVQAQNELSRKEDTVAKTIFMAGLTWPGIMIWDDIRTVDYLISRPEVDPMRIGCIGLSLGGFRSAYLSGLDSRIKCAVVVGWMSAYGKMLKRHMVCHTWMLFIPGLYQYLDLPDIVSMLAPNPLLVIHGSRDELFPPEGVEEAFEKISAIYEKLGARDRFRASVYDTPHEFNADMQEEAFAWFDSVMRPAGV